MRDPNKLELSKIPTPALKMWLAMYQDFVRQLQAELDRRINPELEMAGLEVEME